MLLLKHTLRYLGGIHDHRIQYQQKDSDALAFFADADYSASSDSCSTTGHIHISFGTPVAWSSKNQSAISLCTCEAEYPSASDALQEILWLRCMLYTINPQQLPNPTPLHVDNMSAVVVGKTQAKTKKNRKHVDIRENYLGHHQRNR